MRRMVSVAVFLAGALGIAALPRHLASRAAIGPDFVHFESPHVRPAALTPDGTRLLVVNTADNRLSVFDVTGDAPRRVAEIPVGLEPVSVAARSDHEAWVVNHLSDDVSVVDLDSGHVRATRRVGDEPTDVVFAGTPERAYVVVSNDDRVRAYDPEALESPPLDVPIPARSPWSIARNAAGTRLYVASLRAGNRTTVLSGRDIPEDAMPVDAELPRSPALTAEHGPAPHTALIVQRQGDAWRDMYGNDWTSRVAYTMSDADVVEWIPGATAPTRVWEGVGTANFAVAASPTGDRVAIASTESRNLERFEPRLRGRAVHTRLTRVDGAGDAATASLNPHVNEAVTPGPPAERDSALGIPTGVAFSPDGARVYVTSLASDKLGVVDAATGAVLARVATVSGPTGVVPDAARGRVYVVGRFRNELQTLSGTTLAPLAVTSIGFDPTPASIVAGRRFFYGGFTSGHGDQACASCHLFGDMDDLAWDLGDPTGTYLPAPAHQNDPGLQGFDPMKGPMTTQSLRGLPGTGRLHWRGDREDLDAFNGAFVDLLGRGAPLAPAEMAAFDDFVLPLVYPPNPNQPLDRSYPPAPFGQPSAQRGDSLFRLAMIDGIFRCVDCHALPSGTNTQLVNHGLLLEPQDMKVPQLRNLYKKVGFRDSAGAVNTRGVGFEHDGTRADLMAFLRHPRLDFGPPPQGDRARCDMAALMVALDTGMSPAVGVQMTFDGSRAPTAAERARLDTLCAQATQSHCELVAHGRVGGAARGWRFRGGDRWRPDRARDADAGTAELLALAGPGRELTITAVPPGTGTRIGIDRDRDGALDGDEAEAGTDAGSPRSRPGGALSRSEIALAAPAPNPFAAWTDVTFTLARAGAVTASVHDLLGREVRVLARNAAFAAGPNTLRWDGAARDGRRAPAGVYFVRVHTQAGSRVRPVVRMP